tara:strand:+ start:5907 stop:8867 length:2961 start_codon:yes stop_codon:yes gene_type:complete
MIRTSFLLISLSILIACGTQQNQSDPLNSFEIADGFRIELMAMEPLIADPVDMVIDELGRWYVVEMHGYPLDVSGSGKVKRLLDTDEDGYPDEAVVFADSLVFPTGIMRWKEGFLVTDPPNVLYLEDTDGDGRADKREIVLTGFARSNPQHNVNNPEYGIDNFIYISHESAVSTKNYEDILGDRGSRIHFPNKPEADSLPQNANGLFVKFNPDLGIAKMGSARGQFGHAFDPWGHHFLTSNATHLFHVVMDASYMQRNPDFLIPSGRHYIPKSGRGFEIFPITENPNHQLLTDVGMMTSACGIQWYQGGVFPSDYDNVIFTAEPVHNLIHADRVNDLGSTFESVNLFEDREFLASRDSWFRPVNHYVGPDGALYVMDYYRKIIEHPEWLSDEVIASGDLYAGVDQGRIYRITSTSTSPPNFLDKLNLAEMDIPSLIELLSHTNNWWRMHAQRLLMDREEKAITQLLQERLNGMTDLGRLHAMWVLEGKGEFKEELLTKLLQDDHPAIREQAIRIAENRVTDSPSLLETLIYMVEDENPKVRYQLLLSLGNLNIPQANQARTKLLFDDIEDEWVQQAALSALNPDIFALYDKASEYLIDQKSAQTTKFFERLSELISRSNDPVEINRFLTKTLTSNESIWYLPMVLEGFSNADGLKLSPTNIQLLEQKFNPSVNMDLRSKSLDLLNQTGYFKNPDNKLCGEAVQIAKNTTTNPDFLADALKVVAMTNADQNIELLRSFLNHHSPQVRKEALSAFNFIRDKNLLSRLMDAWPGLLPDERTSAIDIFMKSKEGNRLILTSIESGQMNASSLSWPRTVGLLNSREDDIRADARRILKGNELDNDAVWNEYKQVLSLRGDPSAGKGIFTQTCSPCHQKAGQNGVAFGPDLGSIKNRSESALLLDILQPNRSIADGYELWQVDTQDGKTLTGIIANEGPGTLTLRDAAGQEQTLERAAISKLTAFESSAMPINLQTQITITQMADLLAFLKE